MNMEAAEPQKQVAEPGVEKPPAGIRWVFECHPFKHLFIDLINQANHRTVCHMKVVIPRAKIKTSYEVTCMLCVDAGKGRNAKKTPLSEVDFLKENKIRLVIKNFKPEIIILACVSEKLLLLTHAGMH